MWVHLRTEDGHSEDYLRAYMESFLDSTEAGHYIKKNSISEISKDI